MDSRKDRGRKRDTPSKIKGTSSATVTGYRDGYYVHPSLIKRHVPKRGEVTVTPLPKKPKRQYPTRHFYKKRSFIGRAITGEQGRMVRRWTGKIIRNP